MRSGSKEDQERFLQERVLEYARFVEWFIEREQPPALQESKGKRAGGISAVFWSGGNGLGVAFLAYADLLPQHTREVLEKYIRSYVLYDAPLFPLGLPVPSPDDLYNPGRDPAFPPDRLAAIFLPCLSGHYDNNGALTRQAFEATKLEDFPAQSDFCKALTWEPVPEEDHAEELAPTIELATLIRSALPILTLNKEIYKACTEKLLYDAEFAKAYFPKATVECIVAWRSLSETLYGMYGLKRMILEREAAGVKGRRFGWHNFEAANHMWHWWRPEETAKFFASLV